MALEMLKAQFLADFQTENAELLAHKDNLTPEEEKELEKKIREFNDKVKTAARGYIERKYPSGHYSLSGTNATAVIIANSRNQVAVNNRIAEKTGHKTLKERALGFDARMKENIPGFTPRSKRHGFGYCRIRYRRRRSGGIVRLPLLPAGSDFL